MDLGTANASAACMASLACCLWWMVAGLLAGTLLSWGLHLLWPGPGRSNPGGDTPDHGSGPAGGGYKPRTEPTPTRPASYFPRREAHAVADQLEAVEGVGPAVAAVFRRSDIVSFADLASKEPRELRSILDRAGPDFRSARPDTWPDQARLLAQGDILGFMRLVDGLKAGVEPTHA
jgi:predicted flap endonuclease-1-like 5' DNA nuclease